MIWQATVASGAAVGLGVALIARGMARTAPDLDAALERLLVSTRPDPHRRGVDPFEDAPATGFDGIGAAVAGPLARLGVRPPLTDLELLGRSPASWLGQKVAYALLGLALPPVLAAMLALGGVALPWAVPTGVTLVFATLFWFLPNVDVSTHATQARREFVFALSEYLNLVALERGAGSSASQALLRAANIGDSWPMRRISRELQLANTAGRTSWDALQDLADHLQLPHLPELAEVMRTAGESGSSVVGTLLQRSQALRFRVQTEMQGAANAASERMVVPIALLGIIFMAMLAYPAIPVILG